MARGTYRLREVCLPSHFPELGIGYYLLAQLSHRGPGLNYNKEHIIGIGYVVVDWMNYPKTAKRSSLPAAPSQTIPGPDQGGSRGS
jgi:hypothetical protein